MAGSVGWHPGMELLVEGLFLWNSYIHFTVNFK